MKNIPYIIYRLHISIMVLSLHSILKRTPFKLSFLLDCISRINSISSCFIFVMVLFLLTQSFLPQGSPNTVADGLRIGIGEKTWPIIRDNVTDVITVTEDEIISAMRLVWERMKLLIESSAAVGVAAVLSEKFKALSHQDIKNVGVILCGGNVDLDNLPWRK